MKAKREQNMAQKKQKEAEHAEAKALLKERLMALDLKAIKAVTKVSSKIGMQLFT